MHCCWAWVGQCSRKTSVPQDRGCNSPSNATALLENEPAMSALCIICLRNCAFAISQRRPLFFGVIVACVIFTLSAGSKLTGRNGRLSKLTGRNKFAQSPISMELIIDKKLRTLYTCGQGIQEKPFVLPSHSGRTAAELGALVGYVER